MRCLILLGLVGHVAAFGGAWGSFRNAIDPMCKDDWSAKKCGKKIDKMENMSSAKKAKLQKKGKPTSFCNTPAANNCKVSCQLCIPQMPACEADKNDNCEKKFGPNNEKKDKLCGKMNFFNQCHTSCRDDCDFQLPSGAVLCPGQAEKNYCDCSKDCDLKGKKKAWCACADADACCGRTPNAAPAPVGGGMADKCPKVCGWMKYGGFPFDPEADQYKSTTFNNPQGVFSQGAIRDMGLFNQDSEDERNAFWCMSTKVCSDLADTLCYYDGDCATGTCFEDGVNLQGSTCNFMTDAGCRCQ